MVCFFSLLIVALLVSIAYEDFKHRAIHWFLPPALFALLFAVNSYEISCVNLFKATATNAAFVLLQISLAIIYFSVKERRFVNIFALYFGIGDLLFLLAICAGFSPINYIAFYISSLLLTVIASIISGIQARGPKHQIPLAGIQAILFLAVFLLAIFYPSFNLQSDFFILSYFAY